MYQAEHLSRQGERDRWLVSARRLRRAVAALAAALVLGFGVLAAQASSKQGTHAATTGSTATSGSASSSGTGSAGNGSSSAPESTTQAPTVTSGGS